MKNNLGIALTVTFLALGFTGCNDDDNDDSAKRCNSLCQEQADCDQAPVTRDQCSAVCAANAANTKTSGCDDEYNALLDCTEGLDDKCTTAQDCGSGPGLNWSSCLARYCQANPSTSYCAQSQ